MNKVELVKVISEKLGNFFYSLAAYDIAKEALGVHTAEVVDIESIPSKATFNDILTFHLPYENTTSTMWCIVPINEYQKAVSSNRFKKKEEEEEEENVAPPFPKDAPKPAIVYSRPAATRDYTANIEFYKKNGKLPDAVEVARNNNKAG